MEWPKLKNIIILILLLANLFMVSLVLVQESSAVRYRKQALDNAVSVLESNGIRVDREQIPDGEELEILTVAREPDSEDALAEALLGACEAAALGGGRRGFESAKGTAEFRGNGNFSVTFSDGARTARKSGGEEEHAQTVLKEAGLSVRFTGREDTADGTVLTCCQTWKDVPVYSCVIVLEYEGGSLRSISGLRLMGTPQTAGDGGELISAPTALIRFLNGIGDLGDVCGEITGMEIGYILTAAAEEMRLTPAWYVTTDTGRYSLNALTGALERAE